MTENERLLIVDRINKDLKEKEEFDVKVRLLERLEKEGKTEQLESLRREVANLSMCFLFLGDKNNIIYNEFIGSIREMMDKYEFSDCPHEIYAYAGSFSFTTKSEHQFSISDICHYRYVDDETDPSFAFNSYECLLCGKVVHKNKKDYSDFESKHIVLRNKCLSPYLAVTYYKKLYFQYLYEADCVESATQLLLSKYYDEVDQSILKLNK